MPLAREVGIPFTDVMVRALLAGHKTQTRRLDRTYRVGDILYVREAWRAVVRPDDARTYERRADGSSGIWPTGIINEFARIHDRWKDAWRPPRFMFKALARPERWEVVDEREQHLQRITREDALAEGSWTRNPSALRDYPVLTFRTAWDEINPDPTKDWDANPTVYAYTLRRVSP